MSTFSKKHQILRAACAAAIIVSMAGPGFAAQQPGGPPAGGGGRGQPSGPRQPPPPPIPSPAFTPSGTQDWHTWKKVDSPAPEMTGLWKRAGGSNMYDPSSSQENQIDNAPYNAQYKALYRSILDRQEKGEEVYDATSDCIPTGMPRTMNAVYGMEILQTPGQVTLIAEYFGETRRIFTDGRPHPGADDLEPAFVGHSIGKWEGKELVVDTIGIKTGTALDSSLAPRSKSENQKITERWRMTGPDTLQVVMTLYDPDALSAPWTVVKNYRRGDPDDYVREYVCTENNRDPDLVGLVPVGQEKAGGGGK